jgi:hypothetical protein
MPLAINNMGNIKTNKIVFGQNTQKMDLKSYLAIP